MSNPYSSLEGRAFWRSAIADRNALEIEELYRSKLTLHPEDKVLTAGSCFAQHIGKALKKNGYNWFDAEPGPDILAATPELKKKYGYGVFSFRTGNIYTTALLAQWIDWAFGHASPSDEYWEQKGRIYDPFRPAIEPNGFASVEEMRAAREVTLKTIRTALSDAKLFVFTLGLTEGWVNTRTGHVYPMCPGTLAGEFDASQHSFRNFRYPEIHAALKRVIEFTRSLNPDLQFLLTVSPVPLTATASGNHVLPATTYSKSTLRAVAGDLADEFTFVDYFPSYEIITAPTFRGMFYLPNQREVSIKGVDFVMTHVFAGLNATPSARPAQPAPKPATPAPESPENETDVTCEEAMLEAFGR